MTYISQEGDRACRVEGLGVKQGGTEQWGGGGDRAEGRGGAGVVDQGRRGVGDAAGRGGG